MKAPHENAVRMLADGVMAGAAFVLWLPVLIASLLCTLGAQTHNTPVAKAQRRVVLVHLLHLNCFMLSRYRHQLLVSVSRCIVPCLQQQCNNVTASDGPVSGPTGAASRQ